MKTIKRFRNVIALLLAAVMAVTALLCHFPIAALIPGADASAKSVTWDFTDNATWKQEEKLEDLPFSMPGLVGSYGPIAWVSDDHKGLMTVGGGYFVAKVPAGAALTITFAGEGLPTVKAAATSGGTYTVLEAEPVPADGIYTLTVDGIGNENNYVMYEFPSNGGWTDYTKHQLRTFTYTEPDATVWNFLDNPSWKESTGKLNGLPFDMPGLKDSSCHDKWVSDANLGLMTVYSGSFVVEVPENATLTMTFVGAGFPSLKAGTSLDKINTTLKAVPELNNGVYTVQVNGIGAGNRYVKYVFPNNNGWSDYTHHQLRTFAFGETAAAPEDGPVGTTWDFTGNDSWKESVGKLDGLPFDMPGLVDSSCTEKWVSDANQGLMTVYSGYFIAQVPANAALEITYSGDKQPVIKAASSANGKYTAVKTKVESAGGINTLTVDGIGAANKFVRYEFPANGGWGEYFKHQLRTFTFIAPENPPEEEPEGVVWDFTQISEWKQSETLEGLPVETPGLVGNYGSQQWVSDANLGLMTVGGGVFVAKVPKNSALKITFAGKGMPTVSVGASSNGTFSKLDITPVEEDGVYTLSADAIGSENCYVMYEFPTNKGWSDYSYHQLRTFAYIGTEEGPGEDDPGEEEPEDYPDCIAWDFTGISGWEQSATLDGMPFDMPGLVGNYGSQQWVSQSNMGLMAVGGGVLIFQTAYNSPLKIIYRVDTAKDTKNNSGIPGIAVASTKNGPWKKLDAKPELKDGVYTVSVDAIGETNSFVSYSFPENSGWSHYDLNRLRRVVFKPSTGEEAPDFGPPAGMKIPACDTNVVFNKQKDAIYWDFRDCSAKTSNLFYGGIGRGVYPLWVPDEGGHPSVTLRVGKDTRVVVRYTQNGTKKRPKYYVSNDSYAWTEIKPSSTGLDDIGDTWDVISAIGKNNAFFRFEFSQDMDDFNAGQQWNLLLQAISFNTTNGAIVDLLADDTFGKDENVTKINFVSSSWNQSFNLAKYSDIVGTSGSFVSDKAGFMSLDVDWSTLCVTRDNPGSLQFVMAKNSKVSLDITIRDDKGQRPAFYVSADGKSWTPIKAGKVLDLGDDHLTPEKDNIYRYVFDGIGKSNIYFRFDFTQKAGDSYVLMALRNISFIKNPDYVPPEEPICDTAIYFDSQQDQAYYDFRACEDVTDNMFWGGNSRGVFPCTMPSTGGQPGVVVKVAPNSPIVVRYTDSGIGSLPIYAVSKDKRKWDIVERDWGTKDEKGDNVDVINSVGAENLYFRFEFPQKQKNMDDMQGWLLVLQSIYFNKNRGAGETGLDDDDIDPMSDVFDFGAITDNGSGKKNSVSQDVSTPNLWWVWTLAAAAVCGGAAVFVFLKKKSKKTGDQA